PTTSPSPTPTAGPAPTTSPSPTPTAGPAPTTSPSPTNAGTIITVTPARILDTRAGLGAPASPVPAAGTTTLQVTGRGGVPSTGVSAVIMNVTATNVRADGYITVYDGGTRPTVSNLNVEKGSTRANLVTVPVAPDGTVQLFNGTKGTLDLVADVQAWVSDGTVEGSRFQPTTPDRLLDTRTTGQTVPAGGSVRVKARGAVTGSEAATAAYVNLTAVANKSAGYVTAYPTGSARPMVSNLNTDGQTVANLALVPVGADGTITLYNGTRRPLDLLADLQGFLTPVGVAGDRLVVFSPSRVYDSRVLATPLTQRSSTTVDLSRLAPRATGTGGRTRVAVMSNITVVDPDGAGYLTSYPAGQALPPVSNVNVSGGEVLPNAAVIPLGSSGNIAVYNGTRGNTHLVVDVQGWFVRD
ncbi:MAG: hypothetical protein H7233_16510, partial [Pseudorhodobacter sp.]|nr:hypothetical protein [Frankiaceae bacterium]